MLGRCFRRLPSTGDRRLNEEDVGDDVDDEEVEKVETELRALYVRGRG